MPEGPNGEKRPAGATGDAAHGVRGKDAAAAEPGKRGGAGEEADAGAAGGDRPEGRRAAPEEGAVTVRFPASGGLQPTYHVRVLRRPGPPRHWIWAIYRRGQPEPARVAPEGFRSADEAWEAGRAEFARLGLRPDPGL
jgi:hypothetical protein